MTSWRKLLTPHQDKYLPQDSTRSSLAQSKFARESTLKSSGNYQNVIGFII